MYKKIKPTVKDVAKRAGVSPSTVSRVIANNPKISKATRDRVLKEMEVLQFQPNAIARSLARSRTHIIGIVMPSRETDVLLNPFFPEALRGIVTAAARYEYDVLLSTNSKNKEELDVIKNFIGGGKVDGLILMQAQDDDPNIEYLSTTNFPFALIGSCQGFSGNHVDNDNVQAAYDLTRHILRTGKRKIYFASGSLAYRVTQDRLAGFQKALTDYGLPYSLDQVFTGQFDEESGTRIAEEIFEKYETPDAVVATDDVIAFGLSRTIVDRGYRIPDDIAIGSFNNSILSRYSESPLTTVDIRAFELGQKSVELLMAAMDGGIRNGSAMIEHQLIKRASTLGPVEDTKMKID